MSRPRLLRADTHRVEPWRNGGGVTREIASEAEGGAFAWRLSLAAMTADGPFSRFPGVDRMLSVVDGAGIALACGKEPEQTSLRGGPPLAFPGDAATTARLLDGPVTILNLMSLRGRWTQRLAAARALEPAPIPGDRAFLVCIAGPATIRLGGDATTLARSDVVELDPAQGAVHGPPDAGRWLLRADFCRTEAHREEE